MEDAPTADNETCAPSPGKANSDRDRPSKSCKISIPDVMQRSKETGTPQIKKKNQQARRKVEKDSTSNSSGSEESSESENETAEPKSRKGPMGLAKRSGQERDVDDSDADGDNLALRHIGPSRIDGAGAEAWTVVKDVVVSGGAEINQRLPGGRTWRMIVDEKLLSASNLRQRLLDMWTLLGVVTALVASFAVDGITNSASSFQSFEEVSNVTLCITGTAACIGIDTLYKTYGFLVSTGCLLSIAALAMTMLFYSYLLIQPVSKTRWFVRQNIHLFPGTFILVILAMALVMAGVCVQCVAAFGTGIGYTIVALGAVIFVFILWLIWHLEKQTKIGLTSYSERLHRKGEKKLTSMADVVEKLKKTNRD